MGSPPPPQHTCHDKPTNEGQCVEQCAAPPFPQACEAGPAPPPPTVLAHRGTSSFTLERPTTIREPPPPPLPPPQTNGHSGKNEMYKRENLIGPFLVRKLLGPRPPPPCSLLLSAWVPVSSDGAQ